MMTMQTPKWIVITEKLIFNSAVDDVIADSVKRFLVKPGVKNVDSSTKDTPNIREILD